jgi:hypothetical protein
MSTLAQFLTNPQRAHYHAIIQVFWYLAGTLDLALCYKGNMESPHLVDYSDADYARDITDRKSRTGSLLLINGTPIAWCSHKQSYVATSTTESEYIAATSTTKDIIWMWRLLEKLHFLQTQPTRLL